MSQVLQSVRQENKKQGEAPGKIWEIPKESGETISEKWGNVWGNWGNM